jgi:hypothetical protein
MLKINIYPNPATTQLTLEFELFKQEATVVEIWNVLGQLMYSNKDQFSKGKQKLEIDVSNFTSGVYFVQLFYGDKRSSVKFVKQ